MFPARVLVFTSSTGRSRTAFRCGLPSTGLCPNRIRDHPSVELVCTSGGAQHELRKGRSQGKLHELLKVPEPAGPGRWTSATSTTLTSAPPVSPEWGSEPHARG